jgi:hypothetical protein
MLSLCTIVDLHEAVSNIKSLNVVMGMQERVSFALLLSHEKFRAAVNTIGLNFLSSSCKVPDIVVRL